MTEWVEKLPRREGTNWAILPPCVWPEDRSDSQKFRPTLPPHYRGLLCEALSNVRNKPAVIDALRLCRHRPTIKRDGHQVIRELGPSYHVKVVWQSRGCPRGKAVAYHPGGSWFKSGSHSSSFSGGDKLEIKTAYVLNNNRWWCINALRC